MEQTPKRAKKKCINSGKYNIHSKNILTATNTNTPYNNNGVCV